MALISSASKSGRLLASRRYTHETLTDAQESFTNVLDLQASETYTQAGYLPSSGLPFSGSSQINSAHTVSGSSVLKYWYRHKLTKSNTNNETWFFLSPTGSDSGIGAQLINDNQEVNFVSPKYSTAALATSTTADSTPGYLATLYKSSAVSHSVQTGSLDGDDIVSTNDYIFDYKTGVIEFKNSSLDPTNSEYLYMTVYQYTGTTLATGLDVRGNITGSNLLVTGNSKVEGDLTLGGNITIGDAASDSVSISADLTSHLIPNTDATYDLGSSSQGWNDLHLGSGGVINLDGGDVTLTHSANTITVAGGTFAAAAITGTTIDATTDFTIDGLVITADDITNDAALEIQTAAGDITLDPGGNNVLPGSDNTDALGVSGTGWSDLFLGNEAVINFAAGDVTATHSSNLLSIAGGNTRVIRLEIDSAADYIDVSTDLQIIAAADVLIDPAGGELKVDGNVVPNSDSADSLGASGTAWLKLWVDDIDLNGQGSISIGGTGRIDLDADDDTSIRASADDVITFEAGAVDIAQMTSTMAISGSSVSTGSLGQLNLASGGGVYIPDSVRLNFGDGNDLKVYHSGTHSIIQDTGTGDLKIRASVTRIMGTTNAENQGVFTEDAGVDLYYNGNKKFETTNTGIAITGDMGATISGSSVSSGSFGHLNVIGETIFGGDMTIGDAASDSVSFGADITSHIIPNADATYNLGSTSQGWNDLFLGEAGVINWDNGDATLTQASDVVTLEGATLTLAGGLTNGLSVAANGGIGMTSYNASAAVADLALDIDGMTDIGAAVADGDLLVIDDGAGGTNRKVTVDRLATYVSSSTFAKVSGDITVTGAGVATIAATSVEGSMLNDNIISGQGALGGASMAQADLLLIDDGPGTVKKVTFSNFEDSIFANISGDIAIAAGGAAVVTGATTNAALTAGAGLSSGGTFDGATARTFALDLNEFSSVDVASGDRLATLDSDNSTEQLTTVDDLADYISGSAFSKTSGDITIAGTGVTTIGATKVTGAMLNDDVISGQTNLGSAGVAQSDEFMFSDAGTLKALTFSNLEDSIFANIGGDISIAAGGTATVTGATTNAALTAGDGISAGGTFDGATARTIAIDLSEYSDVQIAAGDKFLVLDSDNSTEQLESVDDLAAFISASAFGKVSGDVSITGAGVATVTGATTNAALTAGVGLSTTSGTFNGGSAVTFALDLSELSSVDVATGDRLATLDSNGSTEQLTTVDDLADYVSGSAFGKVSGDITIAGTGVSTIGADTVANTMLENMAANTVKVRNANSSGDPSDLALATTQILIGDGTGFTAAALSGDVTMTNAGAVSIGATKVTGAMLNDDAISGQGALGGASVAQADLFMMDDGPGTLKKVTFSNLEDSIFGNVSGDATIAAGGALTIAATSVENSMLADEAVDSEELKAGAVDDAHLSDGVATGLAGTGMTATSGVMNVIGGTGVTANANDIAIGQAIGTGDSPTFTGIIATSDVTIQGNLTVTGDRIEAQVGSLQVADHTITVGSGSTTSATMNQAGLDFGVSGSVAFLRYDHSTTNLSSSVDLIAPQLHSTIATGTAPLTVSSTTEVSNLNAAKLSGVDWDAPLAIGGTTAAAGTFTTMTATTSVLGTLGGNVDHSNYNSTNVDIDSGDIASGVTINKSPVITLGGDLSGNVTLSALASGTLTATIVADSVESSMLNDNCISGFSNLGGAGVAQADEFLFSDAGTLKALTFSNLEDAIFGNVSGDATIAAGGALTLASNSVSQAQLDDDAVGAAELASNAVVNASVDASAAIATSKLSGAVTSIASHGLAATATSTDAANLSGTVAAARMAAAQTAITTIYATDLKMGEDEHTAIDFGTANQISFELDTDEDFRMVAGGTFHANADVVAYSSTVASDMNLKENITDMKYGLSDIMKLRGVEYDWKREDMGHDVGVLAQEVEAVIPELVKEVDGLNGRDGFKAVDYNKLVPVLIESIKELKSEIDELKKNQN